MSPPIRDGSGDSIGAIRLGDGSEISEVRTGAGDVLFSAIPDRTVGYWPFNDAADTTTAVDDVGGRDATIQSGVTYDSTTVTEGSHSLAFDGTGVATIPDTFDTLLTKAHTAIVFLYDSNQSSGFDRMWSFEDEYQISLRHSGSDDYEWVAGDFNNLVSISVSDIPSDTWVMMAGRTDYQAGNAELDFFESNGSQTSADGSPPSSPSSQNNDSNTTGFGGSAGFNMTGNLDAPTFVDRYMTDQELADYAASVL